MRFAEIDGDVLVEAEVTGLTPTQCTASMYEKGDCSSGDGMSAGGHFNRWQGARCTRHRRKHHAGDLISLQADAHGAAKLRYTTLPSVSAAASPTSWDTV